MDRLRKPKSGPGRLRTKKYILNGIATLLLFTFYLSLLISCGGNSHKQFDPGKVAFTAEYNPLFDNQLYPSIVLALNQPDNNDLTAQLLPITLQLTSPANNAVLRIVIDSSSLNYVTTVQEILPRRGETYTFTPPLKWKYDRLRTHRQPSSLDLTVTCYINDEQVDIKNLHLSARSVNECPLSLRANGQLVDTRWLFAAYVNEDHPSIPQILSDILDQGVVSQLNGYQSNKSSAVTDQVFAVWYYALNRGIAYSSISCTSNPSSSSNVQHIRFFDEVYNTRQANCIDACVFFASILRKIGLRPLIFVEPCHAYLGYYTDRKQSDIALLETTITSWVNFPELRKSIQSDGHLPDAQIKKIARYLSDEQLQQYHDRLIDTEELLKLVARSLFDKASQYNRESFQNNRQLFAQSDNITYQQLDIELLRRSVLPIN